MAVAADPIGFNHEERPMSAAMSEIHRCLAEVARRTAEGDDDRRIHDDVDRGRAVRALAMDAAELLAALRRCNHRAGAVALAIDAAASLAEREIRISIAALEPCRQEHATQTTACASTCRDRVQQVCLALEAELAAGMGLPTRLTATRHVFHRQLRQRERARARLGAQLQAIERRPATALSRARRACVLLGAAAAEWAVRLLDAQERDIIGGLCERGVRLVWLVPRERQAEVATALVRDIAGFAAVIGHDIHGWPQPRSVAA
jgi:hypothetical protein